MSTHQKEDKAVVVYDSMWGSTEQMAFEIAEVYHELGIKTVVRHVRQKPLSDI